MSPFFRRSFSACLLALPIIVIARAAPPEVSVKADSKKSETAKVDYVLQPQDLLEVQVFQEEEINKQGKVRISQESTITLPLIGTLDLKGKTPRQSQELVRQLYDRDYIVNPQVTVNVLEYAKRYVYVMGQVQKAGPVEFPPEQGLTILEAISHAGAQTRLANLKKVSLRRTNPDGTQGDAKTINVDDIMKGDAQETWPLQPGDVIFVPEKSI